MARLDGRARLYFGVVAVPRSIRADDYLYALLAGVAVAALIYAFNQQRDSYFPLEFVAIIFFVMIFIPNIISLPAIGSMKVVSRFGFYAGVLAVNTIISTAFTYVVAQGFAPPDLSFPFKIAITMGTASLLASAIYAALCRWR